MVQSFKFKFTGSKTVVDILYVCVWFFWCSMLQSSYLPVTPHLDHVTVARYNNKMFEFSNLSHIFEKLMCLIDICKQPEFRSPTASSKWKWVVCGKILSFASDFRLDQLNLTTLGMTDFKWLVTPIISRSN